MRRTPSATQAGRRVLVVDDHARSRSSMVDLLEAAGHAASEASDVAAAQRILREGGADVVVSDLQMPGADGMELLQWIQQQAARPAFVMVTAYASIRTAVAAMRAGAFDYLEKPFDADRLEDVVCRAAASAASVPANAGSDDDLGMVGSCEAMRRFRDRLRRAAAVDEIVLVAGESGVGKELAARAVHQASPRRGGPFIAVNCAAISPALLESELFGHERGAFTGAEQTRIGRFEAAAGGTLLLDEISEIDVTLQAKLLRVLQERRLERVGSCESRATDARVVATTNRDLRAEIAAGRFREDLYFRLAVLPLTPPPLRERGRDVLELAARFLAAAAERQSRPTPTLSPEAERLLLDYDWPGNVRELHNAMARAVVFAEEVVDADDLRPWLAPTPSSAAPSAAGGSLADAERDLIAATLDQFDGHRAKTAAALGIGVRTLSDKIKRYGFRRRSRPTVAA